MSQTSFSYADFDALKGRARSLTDITSWLTSQPALFPNLHQDDYPNFRVTWGDCCLAVDATNMRLQLTTTFYGEVSVPDVITPLAELFECPPAVSTTASRYQARLPVTLSAPEWPFVAAYFLHKYLNGAYFRDRATTDTVLAHVLPQCFPHLTMYAVEAIQSLGLLPMEESAFIDWLYHHPTHTPALPDSLSVASR